MREGISCQTSRLARRERALFKCPSGNYPESVETNPKTESAAATTAAGRTERVAIFEPRSMGTQPLMEKKYSWQKSAIFSSTFKHSSAGWLFSVSNFAPGVAIKRSEDYISCWKLNIPLLQTVVFDVHRWVTTARLRHVLVFTSMCALNNPYNHSVLPLYDEWSSFSLK